MSSLTTSAALASYSTATGRFLPVLGEQQKIATLPVAVRQQLDLWLLVMGRCYAARQLKSECQQLESEMKPTGLRGFSAENIRRVYRQFRGAGWNWRVLVPAYHLPVEETDAERGKLPPAFITWWQRHAGTFSGGTRAAFADLEDKWKRGESIPGFGTWMEWFQTQDRFRPLPAVPPPLPPGCSYENLLEKVPKGAEMTVVRVGFAAAVAELPILRRDRSELRPLELVTWDDHPLDFRIAVWRQRRACKLLGLFGLDVACGLFIEHGAGARIETSDGIERSLTRADGRALLFRFLRRWGVPKHWKMHLLFERASFAISEADAVFLEKISPNIVVDRTPIRRHALLAGGPDETYGSPQAKGWLESAFNLLDRWASNIPGQAGRNPITDKRGTIDAVEAEARHALQLIGDLPPAIAEMAALPLLTDAQAKVVLHELIARINARTRHRLQGFERVPYWRILGVEDNNPWRPAAEMPATLPPSAVEIAHLQESPLDRFRRLYRAEDFEPIPESVLLPLLDDKQPVKVTRPYQFTFRNRGTDRTYTLTDERLERIGTEFTACLDCTTPDAIYLIDDRGAYVGQAELWRGPNPVNHDEIAAAARVQKEQQHRLLKRARDLHAPRAQARIDDLATSNERLAGAISEMEASRMRLSDAEQAGADLATNRKRAPRVNAKAKAADTKRQADRADYIRRAREEAEATGGL